jgi:hypothetical protein
MKEIFNKYPPHLIVNMDEMNIGQGDSHIQVIGRKNDVQRRVKSNYDNKSSLTCCLTIAYDGTALKPMYTRKGKTNRALHALHIDDRVELGMFFTSLFICCFIRSLIRRCIRCWIEFVVSFIHYLLFLFFFVQVYSLTTVGRHHRACYSTFVISSFHMLTAIHAVLYGMFMHLTRLKR